MSDLSSFMAWSSWAWVGTPWCQPTWSSMYETPLPLIVWAITQSGLARPSCGANASSSDAGSWPSASTTSQPKARNLSASGSTSLISATRAPCCKRVAIDDQRQVGELAVSRGHRGFPVAAFLQFAVAGDDEDAIVGLVDLAGDGDADGDRQAVPERPGVRLDARDVVPVGVAVERRQRLHVGREAPRPG